MNSTIKEKLTDMILKNTKVFVQNSENFHQNYNHINKSFYKKQLPLLTHSKISKINSNFQKVTEDNKEQNNTKDKILDIPEIIKVNEPKIFHPFLSIRKVSNLSDSIINYLVIAISLFIYASYNLEWFHLQDEEGVGKIWGLLKICGWPIKC